MLLRLCQLKSLLLIVFLVSSCSRWPFKSVDENSDEVISLFKSDWFKASQEHTLLTSAGLPSFHPFFDVSPDFSVPSRQVNVVITTPKDSEHSYAFDMISGQRHFVHSYCKESRPGFSIGFIPRFLDQLGNPQKVILFGDGDKVKNLLATNYFRANLVGAYVEKICPDGDCSKKSDWLSRLVFIAVDAHDKKFADVVETSELFDKIDWKEMKQTLESMDGKNYAINHEASYIQVSNPISFNEAFDFFKNHSIYMSDREVNKIQKGCLGLYDKLWTEVGVERPEDRPSMNLGQLKEKIKLRNELKKKKLPIGFAKRFQDFVVKYSDEMVTCNRFVYAGNINKDEEKFWFLNFVGFYLRLHKDGYYFDCSSDSWQHDVFSNLGKSSYDIKNRIQQCTDKDIDTAMNYLSVYLQRMKSDSEHYYRFVDYDNHVFGTHSKLYSWVHIPLKKFSCTDDSNAKITKEISVFPEDVKWKNRAVTDIENEMKIFY